MAEPIDIAPATPISESTKSVPDDPNAPTIGRWYYVRTKNKKDDEGHFREKKTWLGCVTHLGSNYALLKGVNDKERIHFDVFDKRCTPAHDALDVIQRRVSRHKTHVRQLMSDVRDITAQLGVGAGAGILPEGETHAIAVRSADADAAVHEYKNALVKAQDKTLPDLFARIKHENEQLAKWMNAELIPMQAEAKKLEKSMDAIKQRIFSVELYAGLVEQIVEITDPSAPAAPSTERVHLMQRRCYMDEESLARYEAGGMDYTNIGEFYAWLARPENRDRILPHPRCVVAFRVRRTDKEYEVNLSNVFTIANEHELNKATYLFIRNGEKLFCLATEIDFEEELFPDGKQSDFTGKLWMRSRFGVDAVITDEQYQGLVEDLARWKAREAAWKKLPKAQREKHPDNHHFWLWGYRVDSDKDPESYTPFEPNSIYYDDGVKFIQDQVNAHNRLVLVLQGLFDRSPVLHPHPPYKLWTPEGFAQAIHLVYDASRVLNPSEKPPDFEAYRARLNESLKVGSVTVGQLGAWKQDEKEQDRAERDKFGYDGPDRIGRIIKMRRARKGGLYVTYRWYRERRTMIWVDNPNKPGYLRAAWPKIAVEFTCKASQVFNVDAYTPGDYRQFFEDPRTRLDYLKWAPFLLAAEDYKAGKLKVMKLSDDGESEVEEK